MVVQASNVVHHVWMESVSKMEITDHVMQIECVRKAYVGMEGVLMIPMFLMEYLLLCTSDRHVMMWMAVCVEQIGFLMEQYVRDDTTQTILRM